MAEPLVHHQIACCAISQIAKFHAFWQSECFDLIMMTERHNIASRLLIITLSKGEFGGNTIFTCIGLHPDGSTKSGLCQHM